MQTTEQRLAKLERVVRWQRFGLVVIMLGAGVALFSGANDTVETIAAREIVIVDAAGKPVGYFGNNKDGTAITMGSEGNGIRIAVRGKQSVVTGTSGKQRFISVCDGDMCLSSVVCADGSKISLDAVDDTPQLRVDDKAGKMRLLAGSNDKSGANIGLFYEDGKIKWKTPQ